MTSVLFLGLVWASAIVTDAGTVNVGTPGSTAAQPFASEYKVTFTETGLPAGTSWSVTLAGSPESSTSTMVTFTEPDGTYLFIIGSVPGFSPNILEGNVTVAGADASQSIEFAPPVTDYFVTFEQAGLPAGLVWSVNFNGTTKDTNSSSTLGFSGPNGSYPFTVGSVSGFQAEPGAGHVVVQGAAVTTQITFSPPTGEYAVTFAETGLSPGTEWSITLNGTTQLTTNSTMTFFEANGAYLYMVGSVPGYTDNPEGNLSVNGASVYATIAFEPISTGTPTCTSFVETEMNYSFYGDCRGSFETDLRSYNATTGYTFENSTFDVGAVAEVGSGGSIAALFVTGYHSTGTLTLTNWPNGVNATDTIQGTVTNAIGLNASSGAPNGQTPQWAANEAPGSVGPTIWGSGSQVLGTTTVVVTFHFTSSAGETNRVEFDVSIAGWPWVSNVDSLGLEIGATAEQQTYFDYSASSDTISQLWDSNGTVAASLVFGSVATATSGGTNSSLTVANQVGLFPSGSEPVEAFSLLTFQGPGGYSSLVYDPWIVFGSSSSVIVPPYLQPGSSVGGAALPLLAVGGIAAVTAFLGFLAYRTRRSPVDKGLSPLAWPERTRPLNS